MKSPLFLPLLLLAFALAPVWSVTSDRQAVRAKDVVRETVTIIPTEPGPTTIMFAPGTGLHVQQLAVSSGTVISATWVLSGTAGMTETLELTFLVKDSAAQNADVRTVYTWGDRVWIEDLVLLSPWRTRLCFPLVLH
jgi:hypothetical protein